MAHTFYIPVPREALEEAYKALSALAKNTLAAFHSSPQPPEDLLDLLAEQASQRADAALTIALALRIPRAQAMADLGLKDLGGLAGALLGPEGLPLSGYQLEALAEEARAAGASFDEAAQALSPWLDEGDAREALKESLKALLEPVEGSIAMAALGLAKPPPAEEPPSFEDDLGRLLAALEGPIASAMGEEGLREFEEAYNKARAASYDLLRLPPEDPEEPWEGEGGIGGCFPPP